MDNLKEWKRIERYPLMWHLQYGYLRPLALRAAIEIACFLNKTELPSNDFAKLKRLLSRTLEPDLASDGQREIDEFIFTGKYLKEAFEYHQQKNTDTPYKLKEGITQNHELAKDLTRVITDVTTDLADLSKCTNERLKQLKNFCSDLYSTGYAYERDFKTYLVA